jgi:hypothetical protein
MRSQVRKPINLRGKIMGGDYPLICIPIVAEEEQELEQAAKKTVELYPDVIEWRADYFKDVCNSAKVKQMLKVLRSIIGEIPLIFTFRSSMEGGFKKVEDTIRYEVIKGNVVVIGDVNPGAHIKAAGSVIILGTVRGIIHAGASGDYGAFIAAYKMQPSQLRIGDTLALSWINTSLSLSFAISLLLALLLNHLNKSTTNTSSYCFFLFNPKSLAILLKKPSSDSKFINGMSSPIILLTIFL